MRRAAGVLTVGLVVGLAAAGLGQMGGMGSGRMGVSRSHLQNFGDAGGDTSRATVAHPVKITATDGKTTMGTLRLTTVVIACSLGVYEIKPDKVQEIRLKAEPSIGGPTGMQRPGTIVTTNGETIDGVVLISGWWRVQTELGTLALTSEELQSIGFTRDLTTPAPGQVIPGLVTPPGYQPIEAAPIPAAGSFPPGPQR